MKTTLLYKNALFLPVIIIATVSIIGWTTKNTLLTSFSRDFIPMAPATIVFFLLNTAIVLLLYYSTNKKLAKAIILANGIVTLLFCLHVTMKYFFGYTFDLETIFIPHPTLLNGFLVARMSPVTSLFFFLLAMEYFLFFRKKWFGSRSGVGLISFVVFVLSLILIIGYMHKTPLLYQQNIIPMALPTALSFMCLSLYLLTATSFRFWPFSLLPDSEVTRILIGRFLPPSLIIVFIIGFADSIPSVTNRPMLESFFLLFTLLVTCLIVYRTSRQIGNMLYTKEMELLHKNEELKLAKEKAEESERLKTAFLANMSHEIRTPMNAICGFSELLIQGSVSPEKQTQFLQIIHQRTGDLLTILNDILDISKIEAGELKLFQENDNLNHLLIEIYHFFHNKNIWIDRKKIDFKLTATLPEEYARVKTDFVRLKQILINLITNAFKFTQEGTIEFGCTLHNEKQLQFYVKDTGSGIPEDKQKIIFDPFRQVNENYLKNDQGGVGLGLSITRGLIELMQGNIWLVSQEGRGTDFYFSLPFVSENSLVSAKPEKTAAKPDFTGKFIVVVEDDKDNLMYISEILKDLNATVISAETGAQAKEIIRNQNNVDLVLMDIRLPDYDGLTITKELLRLNPTLKIIAQTAHTSEVDIDSSKKAGCVDFISKPIEKNKLVKVISHRIA